MGALDFNWNVIVTFRIQSITHVQDWFFYPMQFLVADTQLYKKLCPSVRWSVDPSLSTSRKVGKRACPPLPTRPQLAAVYLDLLLLSLS